MPLEGSNSSGSFERFGDRRVLIYAARWIRIGEWGLLALLAVYFGGRILPNAWRSLNTDFPDYYLTAQLTREGNNISQAYEWVWLQRQKDHRNIDQPIVGLGAITPFSTLVVWPLTSMPPLTAKRFWLSLNLGFVLGITLLLRSLTQISWRRIALITFLSEPLQKNLIYGQYYILLLFVLALAFWCYVRRKRFFSGLLIGLAFGLKLFPLIYLIYFLRKKDWSAFAGGIIGSAGAGIVSLAVFGLQLNRVFIGQVLPWALRGEGMDPYNVSTNSIATLLHRFCIYEPQWNPHPAIHAPWLFSLLLPLVQTILFAPAVLLAEPDSVKPRQLNLEWSAMLLSSLVISTLPASYHFTLLILPVCLMWEAIQERFGFIGPIALLVLYVAIGYSGWGAIGAVSGSALLSVPRLYLMILLCLLNYVLLAARWRDSEYKQNNRVWVSVFSILMLFNIVSGLLHQRGLYEDYQWRLPAAKEMLQAIGPVVQNDSVLFTALLPDGYHAALQRDHVIEFDKGTVDQLSVAATEKKRWTEETGRESTIVSDFPDRGEIHQAQNPVVSSNGKRLAFLREEHGETGIWLRLLDQPAQADRRMTSADLDVLEMSFLHNGSIAFSAMTRGGAPRLFAVDKYGTINSLGSDETRYPAASPDGHWLAYSKLEGGNWHLWLRDLYNGETKRLTNAACNNVEATWSADSKTLVYASDCGRALWFTALCRRPIR
jgi:hypothetical protein